ncbi:hypothetical protein BTA51_14850 [Hahella sp. CCB-MM4]|uniref:sensor domain-containing diguanylate cyclase n=1 Tax=Hahella sp. (strain CCB-MM4) TaxID=1926491 RepID=UPI000B9AD3D3|nr:diguanylate cyclase [Hahella sp. CCB-MM4]OZG72796.1 hypothetical protein BTA51_14850 [Hahella sp. CCB-MM4]
MLTTIDKMPMRSRATLSLSSPPSSHFHIAVSILLCWLMMAAIQTDAAEITSSDSAPAILPLTVESDIYNLGPYVSYYEDKNSQLNFNDILLEKASPHWSRQDTDVPSFGYSDATFWLSLDLKNTQTRDTEWLLELRYPVLDYVDVYITEGFHLFQRYSTGDNLSFYSRPFPHRNFIFPIQLQSGQSLKIYLRVQSKTSMQFPLKLYSPSAFQNQNDKANILQGLYYGIMMITALYNLFLYFSIKKSRFLFYVAFICGFSTYQLSISGYAYQYLWPESMEWNSWSLPMFLSITLLFMAMFVSRFLNLPEHKPRTNKLLISVAVLTLFAAFLQTAIGYRFSIRFIILAILFSITLSLILGIQRSLQKDRSAQYFTLAWLSSLLGAFILGFNKFGMIPRNAFTENSLQIGTAIEVVLISFALGEYIAQQRRARALAQMETTRMEILARKAKEEALEAEKKYSARLEVQVNERTSELQNALKQLESANQRLEKQSYVDELTSLFNRRYFNQRYEMEVKRTRRNCTSLSVIMVDIDYFKKLNDTYGHLFGDLCLCHVASILEQGKHRPGDIIARYGGEEFVVLLPSTPLEGGLIVAERIRGLVENTKAPQPTEGPLSTEPKITISLGVATLHPDSTESGAELLQQADEALYQAKESGRNRVCVAPSKTPIDRH